LLRHAPGVMGGLPSGGPRRARITGSASDSPKIVVTSLVHLYDSPVLMPGLPVQTRAKHSHRAPVIAPGLFSVGKADASR
jgi:predicted alpha/beta-hydrolase family hydrolase